MVTLSEFSMAPPVLFSLAQQSELLAWQDCRLLSWFAHERWVFSLLQQISFPACSSCLLDKFTTHERQYRLLRRGHAIGNISYSKRSLRSTSGMILHWPDSKFPSSNRPIATRINRNVGCPIAAVILRT